MKHCDVKHCDVKHCDVKHCDVKHCAQHRSVSVVGSDAWAGARGEAGGSVGVSDMMQV